MIDAREPHQGRCGAACPCSSGAWSTFKEVDRPCQPVCFAILARSGSHLAAELVDAILFSSARVYLRWFCVRCIPSTLL